MASNRRLQHKAAGIEEFLRVAEALSFSRAAESLGQASSATSKSIARLEDRLGVRLFHRTTQCETDRRGGSALCAGKPVGG